MNDGISKTHYVQVMCKNNPNKACGLSDGTNSQYCPDCPMSIHPKFYSTESHIWQTCPLCNGQGRVTSNGVTTNIFETCTVCNGKKIISKITGQSPL